MNFSYYWADYSMVESNTELGVFFCFQINLRKQRKSFNSSLPHVAGSMLYCYGYWMKNIFVIFIFDWFEKKRLFFYSLLNILAFIIYLWFLSINTFVITRPADHIFFYRIVLVFSLPGGQVLLLFMILHFTLSANLTFSQPSTSLSFYRV